MRPASRGAVRLTGPGPSDPLDIEANYLADLRDLDDLKIGIARAREIGNAAALRSYARGEVAPEKLNQVELEQFIRNGLVTFWHQCGTAKMGRDGTSVVELRAQGLWRARLAGCGRLGPAESDDWKHHGAVRCHRRTRRRSDARRVRCFDDGADGEVTCDR